MSETTSSSATTTLTAEVIPTGGIIKLLIETTDTTGTWVLTREAGGITTTLYDGVAVPLNPRWVDVGDGTGQPLDPATEYTYTFVSASGSVAVAITPAATIEVDPDPYTLILLRVMQGAFASLALPNGWTKRPRVIHAMPLSGEPPLPLVTLQLDLIQQRDVPIGHGIPVNTTEPNIQAIEEVVHRRFRVTVLAASVEEREFYRDCVLIFFKFVMVPLLATFGNNIRHYFQAASSQISKEQYNPGFYFAEVGLGFDGVFAANLTTNYGLISAVNPSIQSSESEFQI